MGDLWALIRSLGIDLVFGEFPGAADGLYMWDGSHAIIVVNRAIPDYAKQRFTAAHELGHHLLHGGTPGIPMEIVDEDVYKGTGSDEKQANAFAAYLLAPDEGMASALAGVPRQEIAAEDVADLMHEWGISFRTAVYRLHNAGRILAADRDRLISEASGRVRAIAAIKGYDRSDLPYGDELPSWYVMAVIEMLAAETIDRSRASHLLRRTAEEVDTLLREVTPEEDADREEAFRDLLGDDYDAFFNEAAE